MASTMIKTNTGQLTIKKQIRKYEKQRPLKNRLEFNGCMLLLYIIQSHRQCGRAGLYSTSDLGQ